MKAYVLRGGLAPWRVRRTAVDGRRWSLKWSFNNFVTYGRSLFRSLIEEGIVKQKPRAPSHFNRKLENPVSGRYSKSSKWPVNINRIFSRWCSESWAAELRRNAAKSIMFQGGTTIPLFTFVGFTLAKEPSLLSSDDQLQMACQEIRQVFKTVNEQDNYDDDFWPKEMSVSELELGKVLAKGCNAVVYSANWKRKHMAVDGQNSSGNLQEIDAHTDLKGKFGLKAFQLAVKIMFNYDAESNASSIWRAMSRESIPAQRKYLPSLHDARWALNDFHLPSHPNVVKMHCAFADLFPNLPEGIDLYPDALPLRLNRQGYGRNMTLVLVMNRYDCSLKEYLQSNTLSADISLKLFTQLLEGILHLQKHKLSHRDLKADNILLNLKEGTFPHLVITDFGCCLANRHLGFKLPFTSEDVFRGGNVALMPPEVVTALPGKFNNIDYSKADLWVAGALAYEIFGGKNPFYEKSNPFHLDSRSYSDADLPALPCGVQPLLENLVWNILCRNPKKRPAVEIAATCCQLLLHAPPSWREIKPKRQDVICWLAETALQHLRNKQARKTSLLMNTFLARVQLDVVMETLNYLHSQ